MLVGAQHAQVKGVTDEKAQKTSPQMHVFYEFSMHAWVSQ